jgi:hypothetical protein
LNCRHSDTLDKFACGADKAAEKEEEKAAKKAADKADKTTKGYPPVAVQ